MAKEDKEIVVKKESKLEIKAFLSLVPIHEYYKQHYIRKYKGQVNTEKEWKSILKKDGIIK